MKTETEVKHTPTPWHSSVNMEVDIYACGFRIACMKGGEIVRDKANAAYIVRAVNCHEELLELAKSLHSHLGKSNGRKIGCADCETIAKAESK